MSKSLDRSLQRVKGTTQQLHMLLLPRTTGNWENVAAAVGRRADEGNFCVRLLEESCTLDVWANLPAAALNCVDVRKVPGA